MAQNRLRNCKFHRQLLKGTKSAIWVFLYIMSWLKFQLLAEYLLKEGFVKNNQNECRRQALLEHFGENFNRTKCKEGPSPCDNCLKMSSWICPLFLKNWQRLPVPLSLIDCLIDFCMIYFKEEDVVVWPSIEWYLVAGCWS